MIESVHHRPLFNRSMVQYNQGGPCYNAALIITGAIHGSSREKLYHELGFESLHDKRCYGKLCFYYINRAFSCYEN